MNTFRNLDYIGDASDVNIVSMTINMVPEVARLHMDAFAGYLNTRIGPGYVRAVISWFCNTPGTIALAAVDANSKVLGYAVGAASKESRSMTRDLFWTAAARIIVRPWLFLDAEFRKAIRARFSQVVGSRAQTNAESSVPEPMMALIAIAVSPAARGRKIGLRLMQAFESKARDLKMRSLGLSVIPQNVIARQLYESCGWTPFLGSIDPGGEIYYYRVLAKDAE